MLCASLLIVLVAVWATTAVSATKTAIVQTDSGPVRGEEVTYEGTSYKAFKGIPYAAPPVGNLRFTAPQPPQKWTEVKDVISYGKLCYQQRLSELSSEDCLTLNVFTQSLGKHNLKPVLVWIHGGGFYCESGTDMMYGPEFLIQGNIVVVTFNYRLGPLGFLATNTPDATGNWGLKDQVLALKWVQTNIEQFGGDPKQVTIYGESAGAQSVQLHLISPLSKGLFQKAITSSGTLANIEIFRSPAEQEHNSRYLARLLGASENEYANPQKRVQFLRKADPKEMAKLSYYEMADKDTSNVLIKRSPFSLVIEPLGTKGAFLTEDPLALLIAGKFTKVPMMMGLNDLEGGLLYMTRMAKSFTPEHRKEIEGNICQILPEFLRDDGIARNGCPAEVAQRIREVYFDGKGFDSSMFNFVNLWGDITMSKHVHFSQRIHSKYAGKENPVYNYYFTFDGKWNSRKFAFKIPFPGAIHADELSYVFLQQTLPQPKLPESSPEVITKNRMISFITNFVKTGDPTPVVSGLVPVKWVPSTEKKFLSMVIGNDLKMEKDVLKTRMDLWDELTEKYASPDSPECPYSCLRSRI